MIADKGTNWNKFIITFIVFTICMFLSGLFTGKAFASENIRYAEIKTYTTASLPYGIYCIDGNGDAIGSGWDYHYIIVSDNKAFTDGIAGGFDLYFNKLDKGKYNFKIYKAQLYDGHYGTYGTWDGKWRLESDCANCSESVMFLQNLTAIEDGNYNVYVHGEFKGDSYELSDKVFFSQIKGMAKICQHLPFNQVLLQVQSLLPILIPLVVGFLGLRKGLALLHQTLHQA